MGGPNTTGVSRVEDYVLGRGSVYLTELNATTGKPSGGWRMVGNAPDFKASITTETLKHQSSLQGLKVIDKEIVISQEAALSLTLEELNHENLALFFSGEKSEHTNVAVAGFTIRTLIANADLAINTWYDVVNSSDARAYDIQAADLTLATSAGSPVTLVEGTDYDLDTEMGRVFIKDTAAITTAIAGGGTNGNITAVLAADGSASDVNQVSVLTVSPKLLALKFIGKNPANEDEQVEVQYDKVTLVADGDLAYISDDITKMTLKGSAVSNSATGRVGATRSVATPR